MNSLYFLSGMIQNLVLNQLSREYHRSRFQRIGSMTNHEVPGKKTECWKCRGLWKFMAVLYNKNQIPLFNLHFQIVHQSSHLLKELSYLYYFWQNARNNVRQVIHMPKDFFLSKIGTLLDSFSVYSPSFLLTIILQAGITWLSATLWLHFHGN